MSAHTGRRRGPSGTREAILEAARRQFAEHGYDRTSMRKIAAEAGVDATLVSHFHGTKQRLFLTVVELPVDPAEALPRLLEGGRRGAGERLARMIVGILESDDGRARMTGLVRAAASEPEAARKVRELFNRSLFLPLIEGLEVDHAGLRSALIGSQVVGLVMARYVVAVEPLASLDSNSVVSAVAPVLQHYLTDPLGV